MKVNKLLVRYNLLLLIAIVESIVLILLWGPIDAVDTKSYIEAWELYISQWELDVFRTPIYPIIIGVFKSLMGDYFPWGVCCLQHVAFIVSVSCLYQICEKTIKSHAIVFIIALCYIISQAITAFNNYLLTESFAISGVVLMLHSMLLLHQKQDIKHFLYYFVVLLFLVFLRPSFLYILPLLFVYYFVVFLRERRIPLAGVTSVVFVSLFMLAYMLVIKSEYGIFTPSRVSIYNQLWIARNYGLLNPEVIENQDFKQCVEYSYKKNGRAQLDDHIALLDVRQWAKYDWKITEEAVTKSMKKEPKVWLERTFGRTYQNLGFRSLIPCDRFSDVERMLFVLGFSLNIVILLTFISVFFFLYLLIRKKVFNRVFFISNLLVFGNLVTVVIGAPNDWHRLFIPSLTLVFIMLGYMCSCFRLRTENRGI